MGKFQNSALLVLFLGVVLNWFYAFQVGGFNEPLAAERMLQSAGFLIPLIVYGYTEYSSWNPE